jgi:hypothetical protein
MEVQHKHKFKLINNYSTVNVTKRNDRIVGKAGVRVPVRLRIFTSPYFPDWLRGPLSLVSNGLNCSFPGIKRLESEADYSLPTGV